LKTKNSKQTMTAKKTSSEDSLRTELPVKDRLKAIRVEIDEIDLKILELLNGRAGLCREVGRIKSRFKDSVFKPFREKEVLDRLTMENAGMLPEEHLHAIYREILSSSRRLQKPQAVVYLGPEGTFSFFAGVEYLGQSTDFKPCSNLDQVFQTVAANEAELGIIPLENSLQGSVGQSLDMFLKYDVYIQSEMFCKISHALLSKEDSTVSVRTVYSHPQALEQCSVWLRTNLPGAVVVPVESTAAAARMVVDNRESAAIGHIKLSKMFDLNVLSSQIEDMPDNWTRFMIIGASVPTGGNQDKTSLLFTLPDKSGALVQVLTLLAQGGINMKKLESRPLRSEKWKYVFFADIECDLTDDKYKKLKKDLENNCHSLRVLGSYPAGPYLSGV
jgi:chorismate mutase/prephenate dehydratase